MITDSLLDLLTPEESAAVLMHEWGHLVHGHVGQRLLVLVVWQVAATVLLTWFDVASVATGSLAYLLFYAVGVPWVWQRAELVADRFAKEHCGSGEPMAAALRKMHRAELLPVESEATESLHTHPGLLRRLEALGVEIEKTPREGTRKGRLKIVVATVVWLLLVCALLVLFQRSGYPTNF